MILLVQIIKHKITTQIIKVLGLILEFPSGQVLLETIRHEYDIEASRKRDIETTDKSSFTIHHNFPLSQVASLKQLVLKFPSSMT